MGIVNVDILEVDDVERFPDLGVHTGAVELDAPAKGIFELAVDEGGLEGATYIELLVAADGDLFKVACFAEIIYNILGVTSKCGHFIGQHRSITFGSLFLNLNLEKNWVN